MGYLTQLGGENHAWMGSWGFFDEYIYGYGASDKRRSTSPVGGWARVGLFIVLIVVKLPTGISIMVMGDIPIETFMKIGDFPATFDYTAG